MDINDVNLKNLINKKITPEAIKDNFGDDKLYMSKVLDWGVKVIEKEDTSNAFSKQKGIVEFSVHSKILEFSRSKLLSINIDIWLVMDEAWNLEEFTIDDYYRLFPKRYKNF